MWWGGQLPAPGEPSADPWLVCVCAVLPWGSFAFIFHLWKPGESTWDKHCEGLFLLMLWIMVNFITSPAPSGVPGKVFLQLLVFCGMPKTFPALPAVGSSISSSVECLKIQKCIWLAVPFPLPLQSGVRSNFGSQDDILGFSLNILEWRCST